MNYVSDTCGIDRSLYNGQTLVTPLITFLGKKRAGFFLAEKIPYTNFVHYDIYTVFSVYRYRKHRVMDFVIKDFQKSLQQMTNITSTPHRTSAFMEYKSQMYDWFFYHGFRPMSVVDNTALMVWPNDDSETVS